MRLVLDASAAIEVALHRGGSGQSDELLVQADEVLAPDLFVPEVVNTVWKYHRFERLNISSCDQVLELALGLVDTLIPCKDLYHARRTICST